MIRIVFKKLIFIFFLSVAGKTSTKVNGTSSTPANKTLNDKKKSDLSESASLGAFLQCDSDDDDDEVIVCEKDKEDSGAVLSKSNADKSKTTSTKSSGPICRVENCDIYENGQEVPETAEPLASKADKRSNQNDKEVVEVVEDDIEMTEVLNDAGGDFVITTNNKDAVARMNNACSKRLRLDSPAAKLVQLKKSRLEAAESEVLTTMCAKNQTISSPLSTKPNSKSITRSSKVKFNRNVVILNLQHIPEPKICFCSLETRFFNSRNPNHFMFRIQSVQFQSNVFSQAFISVPIQFERD